MLRKVGCMTCIHGYTKNTFRSKVGLKQGSIAEQICMEILKMRVKRTSAELPKVKHRQIENSGKKADHQSMLRPVI